MKKQTFTKRCFCLCLTLILTLSLAACGGSNSNDALNRELTETQKDEMKRIAYDIVPKTLFAMTNGATDQLEFLKNSTHVTENFREGVINSTQKRSITLYNNFEGYVTSTVFTTPPAITNIDFYGYYYESGTHSVTARMVLACTLQKKDFGGAWREGTPYQETRAYECSICWDDDECYLISSLHLV